MSLSRKAITLTALLLGTAFSQDHSHMEGMNSAAPIYVASDDNLVTVTAAGTQPKLDFMYHIHYPTNMESTASNVELHMELRIYNFNVTGWTNNATNKVILGLSWADSAANKTDAIMCTLPVTLTNYTEKYNCVDGYLGTSSKSNISLDTINNAVIDASKANMTYWQPTAATRLLNFTAHFDRLLQTNDSTDTALSMGQAL